MWSPQLGQFTPYQTEATVDIELAYQLFQQGGSAQVDLSQKPSKIPYTIDFQLQAQTRHHYHTRRAIQRVALPTGSTLQALLTPLSGSLTPTVTPANTLVSRVAGAGTGSGLGSVPYYPVTGATPYPASYATGSGSGLMAGTTPLPHSYGSGLSAGPPLTGYGTSGTSHHPGSMLGPSYSGVPHLGYLPGVHPPPPPAHITPTTSISSLNVSSSFSTSPAYTLPSYHSKTVAPTVTSSTVLSNPPSAATRSKSGGRKTKATAASVPEKSGMAAGTSVPKKTGKGKSQAKSRNATKEPSSVSGASNHGDDALAVYARKVNKLRAKSDEVSRWSHPLFHMVWLF